MNHQEDVGKIVGGYRVLRQLGSGGGGTVYLVWHIRTEGLRAAKILHMGQPGEWFHELDVMKQLHHPALPQILDVLEENNRLWLIMEYINGKSLVDLVYSGMKEEQFFQIAKGLAEALIYLHSRTAPVLHLDVKPSNVLVRKDGCPVLVDFGAAARDVTDGSRRDVFGTRGFASPEQMDGTADLDVRADIYGFGATMFFCFYGRIPQYNGKPVKVSVKNESVGVKGAIERSVFGNKTSGKFPGKKWTRTAVPILKKCLKSDRDKRYQDMKVLYRDLCRAERIASICRCFWKLLAALLFFASALLFLTASLVNPSGEKLGSDAENKEAAELRLLEMAEGLGFEPAFSCYKEAALLYPAGAWSIRLLQRIEEDFLFDSREENIVKELIYTVLPGTEQTIEQVMQETPQVYGAFAYRMGLLYWYFYENTGGKSAAAKWFGRAAYMGDSFPEKSFTWREPAQVYASISSYYERIGRYEEEELRQEVLIVYWNDLKRLWTMDSIKSDVLKIQQQVGTELLALLIMSAYEIRQSGERLEEMQRILNSFRIFIQESFRQEEQEREVMEKQWEAADAAVERVFADERGKEYETEQKSAK